MKCSVIIPTYGDLAVWVPRAQRAYESVYAQTFRDADVLHLHADTLQAARNDAAGEATGEWLCFLDADDTLDPRYLEEMFKVADGLEGPWLLQPSTLGVYPDGHTDDEPVLIPAQASILTSNWMVIGTLVRRDQFLDVGGFRDLPALEDWDLWIRCVQAGAQLATVPDAVYRVGVNPESRNQNRAVHHRVFSELRTLYR